MILNLGIFKINYHSVTFYQTPQIWGPGKRSEPIIYTYIYIRVYIYMCMNRMLQRYEKADFSDILNHDSGVNSTQDDFCAIRNPSRERPVEGICAYSHIIFLFLLFLIPCYLQNKPSFL